MAWISPSVAALEVEVDGWAGDVGTWSEIEVVGYGPGDRGGPVHFVVVVCG